MDKFHNFKENISILSLYFVSMQLNKYPLQSSSNLLVFYPSTLYNMMKNSWDKLICLKITKAACRRIKYSTSGFIILNQSNPILASWLKYSLNYTRKVNFRLAFGVKISSSASDAISSEVLIACE